MSATERDWRRWRPRNTAAAVIAEADLEHQDPSGAATAYAILHVGDQLARIADVLEAQRTQGRRAA